MLCVPGDTFLFFHEPPDGQWGVEHRLGVPAGALLLHGPPLAGEGGSPDVAHLLHCGSQCPACLGRHFLPCCPYNPVGKAPRNPTGIVSQ